MLTYSSRNENVPLNNLDPPPPPPQIIVTFSMMALLGRIGPMDDCA